MTTKAQKASEKKVEEANGKNPLVKMVRTVLLATMGSVALGKEEIESIINRLVEKGEIAEKDGRELLSDLFEQRKKEVSKMESRIPSIDQHVESILNRMNVPSKSDVESLSRKISTLSKKVDELNKKIGE